jgi:hypothetical protein
MTGVVDRAIREPFVADPTRYAQRIHRLAWAYLGLFFGSAIGIGLIIWQGQFFVTLSQRSNVETLTLAFFLFFFAYLVALSARGAWGAARIFLYALRARLSSDRIATEREKTEALRTDIRNPATVALNVALELGHHRGAAFTIPIRDAAGSMGELVVDGVEITHRAAVKDGSDAFLAYFVDQVNRILSRRGDPAGLNIVEWKKINDEATDEYLSMARFARNLERHLDCDELWPKRTITQADCEELERQLTAVCAALRNEAFLPHWEYEGVHQLPLIPEPLGLFKLSRSEKRVDPLASMGCAVAIVAAVVVVILLFILFPPWVPS